MPASPLKPDAAQQMQQHRLDLIVGVVGDGDPRRADLARDRGQEIVAGDARRRFDAEPPLLRQRAHVGVARRHRQLPRLRRLDDEARIRRARRAAQAVIERGDVQTQAQ